MLFAILALSIFYVHICTIGSLIALFHFLLFAVPCIDISSLGLLAIGAVGTMQPEIAKK